MFLTTEMQMRLFPVQQKEMLAELLWDQASLKLEFSLVASLLACLGHYPSCSILILVYSMKTAFCSFELVDNT